MTVIIGLEIPGGFVIGADRFFGSTNNVDVLDRPKYVTRGQLVLASAGEFRPGQVAEMLALGTARQRPGEDDQDYLLRTVVEPIRKRHSKERGEMTFASERWSFLAGYRGRIYTLYTDYGVARSSRGFAAIGAGEDFAVAGILAYRDKPPLERMRRTLEDVATLCPSVCAGPDGKFDIVTVKMRAKS